MKCNVCGRHTQNEEANFCDYCGSPFREHMQAFYDIQKERYAQEQNMYSERTAPNVQHNMQRKASQFRSWISLFHMVCSLYLLLVG